jgi:hypothetical protein
VAVDAWIARAATRELGLLNWHHSLHVAKQEGLAEGRADGCAQGLLVALEARGLELREADRERIRGCHDPEQLDRWLSRVMTASSIAEVLAD